MNQENSRTGIVTGVLLILLGVAFLALQFLEIKFWSGWWPTAVIGVGLLFFIAMLVSGKSGGVLAIPGSIIVMVGLILLFHNTFGFWETWAYAWTLIVFAAGIGISIFGRYTNQDNARRSGGAVARLGLVLFVLFAIFFELFIGLSGFFDGKSVLWPLLLILFGFYLLLARSGLFAALSPRRATPQPIHPPASAETETPAQAAVSEPFSEPVDSKSAPIELPPGEPLSFSQFDPDRVEPPLSPVEDVDEAQRRSGSTQE
jgi:hypothetical protein